MSIESTNENGKFDTCKMCGAIWNTFRKLIKFLTNFILYILSLDGTHLFSRKIWIQVKCGRNTKHINYPFFFLFLFFCCCDKYRRNDKFHWWKFHRHVHYWAGSSCVVDQIDDDKCAMELINAGDIYAFYHIVRDIRQHSSLVQNLTTWICHIF